MIYVEETLNLSSVNSILALIFFLKLSHLLYVGIVHSSSQFQPIHPRQLNSGSVHFKKTFTEILTLESI